MSKIEGQYSLVENDQKEYMLRNDKHSEKNLIGRSVKTTFQMFYDKSLFDNFNNVSEVLRNYLLIDQVNGRIRPDLEEVNDVIQ